MQKSFNHNRVYYTALLDDWIVIIRDCSGKDIKIYNTEVWTEWDNSEKAVLTKAVEIFCK